jgi:galactose-1-phosphate uridylyltransferase
LSSTATTTFITKNQYYTLDRNYKDNKGISGINPMLFDRITASGKIRVSIYRRSHPKEIP